MSRAYSSTPLSQLTRDELEEILLTPDGRGREVKAQALALLMEPLASAAEHFAHCRHCGEDNPEHCDRGGPEALDAVRAYRASEYGQPRVTQPPSA